MIWSPVAAAVRNCVRFWRRRVAVAPAEPPRLTMQQAAALWAALVLIVVRLL